MSQNVTLHLLECTVETVIPVSLPYSKQEICILFKNLLENAYETCRKVAKDRTGSLSVPAKVDNVHLLLEIRNTTKKTVQFEGQGLPLSNQSGGGLETKSVAKIIETHGDTINFSKVHEMFTVEIMIHL